VIKSVLLVETEHGVRKLLFRHLEQFGLNIVEATTGEEGIAKFKARRESLAVIVSGELEGLVDGGDLLKAVRQIDPVIPIFFFLGHSLPPGILYCDGVEVFEKPFGARILCQSVANLIAAERSEDRYVLASKS